MLHETYMQIYNKRMLIAQDCLKFRRHWARACCMTEISCKQFCWFLGCAGKINLDFVPSLVAFAISNPSATVQTKNTFNIGLQLRYIMGYVQMVYDT